ncbi:MAG: DUF4418 family protein [Planctomycetota bacterium]|jgi:hypothetical protein|nr:DUF4418 family protein [Planctomycetota bacterium]
MKNRIVSGIGAIVAGLLIALGPQFLFKLCGPMADGQWMKCHWTGRAEIGVGFFIVVLGLGLLLFAPEKIRLGLSLPLFFAGFLALSIPHALIGGCEMERMPCRAVAFPSLTVIGVLTIAGFAINSLYLYRKGLGEGRRA